MLNYSIDDLRAFCYAARTGQFQEAAELLFVSPSALSRRIANLEGKVGASLFHRSTRQLKLTPLGAELYPKVSPLLAQLDAAISGAARAAQGKSGSVSMGAVATVAFNIAPKVLEHFRQTHPEVAVSIHDGLAISIASLVEQGKVEFGIATQMAFGAEVEADQICEYGYVLVAAHDDLRFADVVDISWGEVSHLSLIGLGPTSSTRLQIQAEMRRLDLDLHWVVEIDQLSTILEMVRATKQLAVLPSLVSGLHSGLRFLPITEPTLSRGLFAIRRRHQTMTAAASTLLDYFRKEIAARSKSSDSLLHPSGVGLVGD